MNWQTHTQSNRCAYVLPPGKRVLGVRYLEQNFPWEIALFFVEQAAEPLWHATSANGRPESLDEAKDMLEKLYSIFNVGMWTVYGDTLVIWPPAFNDGDVLSVELTDASD